MNKRITLILVLTVLLIVGLGYRSYRGYKAQADLELVQAREAADGEQMAERERRAATELEALRLVALQANHAAVEAAHQRELLLAEQLTVEVARIATEKAAARLAQEQERLGLARAIAQAEARRLATVRDAEAVAANDARLAALAKLRTLEEATQQRAAADRGAARLAARQRQQEIEALAAYQRSTPSGRIIYPTDYKRREHRQFRSLMEWDAYFRAMPSLPAPTLDETGLDSK